MAGIKRQRDIEDIGDRPAKLPIMHGAQEEFNTGHVDPPRSTSSLATASSKLRAPSTRNNRQPFTSNVANSHVTTRKKRSASAPPKDLRPPAAGIIKGQRTADVEAVTAALNKSTKSRHQKGSDDDPRWQRFEAQRNTGTSTHVSKTRLGAEMQEERARVTALQSAHVNLETELRETKSQELLHRRGLLAAADELAETKKMYERKLQELENEKRYMERKWKEAVDDCRLIQNDLKMERDNAAALKASVAQQSNTQLTLQAHLDASQRHARSLQEEVERRLGNASEMQIQLEESLKRNAFLEAEAVINEQLRRKLHNQIQELKGNIRVYVRVRPVVKGEKDEMSGQAAIAFPDQREHREIVLMSESESAMGSQRKEVVSFNFDRVFEPQTTQVEIFDEVSQLVQSVTDGYNVTIFAYGQTGSGKSFTMEGGSSPSTEGMIPRAVRQLFQTGDEMRSKGWEYTMEGQFLEIYNETINDLLGQGEIDSKKHDIKHDKSGRTTVTDAVTMPLSGPSQVASLLTRAQSRRSVASTLMNQRSSRSHSVFTLRVSGHNNITGESCEGCLNLVDLAGSERLSSSGAANDKDRLRETQAINKSLSALGDVVASLGAAGDAGPSKTVHIPYRNSKLTYLLQNSLGGNSKTLMILNLSPMVAHYGESLCSLRFATKVNNTTIGKATAKKSAGVTSAFAFIHSLENGSPSRVRALSISDSANCEQRSRHSSRHSYSTTMPSVTISRKVYLLVYNSHLFPAHWTMWIPSAENDDEGKGIHVTGDSATGFSHEFKRNYNLKMTARGHSVIFLADVESQYIIDVPGASAQFSTDVDATDDIERVALLVPAPGKSLRAPGDSSKGKVEIQNCQTWLASFVQKLVDDKIFPNAALEVMVNAPRN